MIRSIATAIALLAAAPSLAAPSCAVPDTLATPHEEGASARDPQRVLPIGSYTLSLIWLAERCRNDGGEGGGFGCKANGARGGFVLHGLWPDGRGREWPQWCAAAPILPAAVLKGQYCATPSAQLVQHEWAKHGTCMAGYTPDRYFALSTKLFEGLTMPNLRALSYRSPTAATVQQAIAAANPGISADMMRLNVNRRGWLEEVWFCLDTRFKPQRCPATQGGAAADKRVLIWRGRAS